MQQKRQAWDIVLIQPLGINLKLRDTQKMATISARELKNERFRLLEDIAKELEGDIVFPTCFDVSSRISEVMRNERASLQQIAAEVLHDPLVASKILRFANSVTYNPSGHAIADIDHALSRIGLDTARAVALACALAQLAKANEASIFADELKSLLLHSLKTGMIARVLARRLTPRINPETAMLAGLVHDLGAFFMFNRVVNYAELVDHPETVRFLVAQWHESIGSILLDSLGMPEEVIDAVQEVDVPRAPTTSPRSLSDIIYIANLFAGGFAEMQRLDLPDLQEPAELKDPKYTALQTEMDDACTEILQLWQ